MENACHSSGYCWSDLFESQLLISHGKCVDLCMLRKPSTNTTVFHSNSVVYWISSNEHNHCSWWYKQIGCRTRSMQSCSRLALIFNHWKVWCRFTCLFQWTKWKFLSFLTSKAGSYSIRTFGLCKEFIRTIKTILHKQHWKVLEHSN